MGNPTERRRMSTASFSPGHSGLQETSNYCAVIIQKYLPRQDPEVRPGRADSASRGFPFTSLRLKSFRVRPWHKNRRRNKIGKRGTP